MVYEMSVVIRRGSKTALLKSYDRVCQILEREEHAEAEDAVRAAERLLENREAA